MKWLQRVLRLSAFKNNRRALSIESLETRETPASIAGNVFKDFDNNGSLNGPDSVISGVTVRLTGGTLTTPTTVTTDSSGNFSFPSLAAGTYTVTVTAPANTVAGKSTAGTAAGTAGLTNTVSGIVLTANQDATGYLFGEVPTNVSLAGLVYDDANGNGAKDTGENGIAGVSVRLTGTSALTGTAITAITVTTDSTGAYVFNNLNPGTYSVAETPKTGFVRGTLQNGTPAAASTASGSFTGINLTSTSSPATNFNFADIKPSALTLTETVSSSRVKSGDTVTVTFVAKNPGTRSVDNVAAAVNLDSLTYVSSAGAGFDSTTKTWTIGTLAAGASATLTITARVGSTGVFVPTARLVSTSAGSSVAGDTSFAVVTTGSGGITMQNFLSSTYRVADAALVSNPPVYPPAPGSSTTAPTTPTIQFFNAAGTTQLTGASTTESTTVIKGVTSASTAVTIVETGATTTSDSTGAYSFTAVPLTVGSNTFTVRAGTGTNTSQATGTVTRTAVNAPTTPTIQFFNAAGTTQLTGASTTESTTVIKGVTSASTAVTIVETGATATSDSTGAYTFSAVPVTIGSNTFTVRAGTGTNTSQATGTVTRVVAAPTTPTIQFFNAAGTTQLTETSTTEGTTVIKGVTSANTAVTIVETAATTTSDSTGAYSFTAVPVIVGSNTYTVIAGTGTNTSQATGTLTGTATSATPTAPTIQFFNAAGDTQITTGSTVESTTVIKGTTDPNTPLRLAGTSSTTTSDSTGAYSFTAVPVAIGANTYRVNATGTDGTTIQTSANLTGAVPATPTITFFNAAGDMQLTGTTTSEGSTVIQGITDPNTVLTLVESGATTTSDSTGAYSFPAVQVIVGSNTYTVKAGAGTNTSQATGTLTGTATSATPTAPTITFFNAAGDTQITTGTTNETTTVIIGTTSPDTPLKLVETGATTTSDSTGAYSFAAVPVVVGSNAYTIQATGTDGTTSQTGAMLTGTTPPTAPTTPTILFFNAAGTTEITTGTTSEETTVIKGVTSPNTPLTLTETSATTTSDSTGAYSFTAVPVVIGSNTYTITAGSGALTSQAIGTITGTTPAVTPTTPTIQFFNAAGDTPLTGSTTNEGSVVINGTTTANTAVKLLQTGDTSTSDSAGDFSFTAVPVIVGSNTYTVVAGTGALTSQNSATLTGTATSETPTAPTVRFFNAAGTTQLTGATTNEGTTVINGTTSPDTNLVLKETGASATSDSTGAYSFDAVPVIVGSNTYHVQASGTDGTTRQTTATLTGTATSATPTSPTILFFNAAGDTQLTGGTTSESTTVIQGVTSPDVSLTLVETSATTASDSTGAYTFDAVPVVVGSNTYTIQATGSDGTTRQNVGSLTGT